MSKYIIYGGVYGTGPFNTKENSKIGEFTGDHEDALKYAKKLPGWNWWGKEGSIENVDTEKDIIDKTTRDMVEIYDSNKEEDIGDKVKTWITAMEKEIKDMNSPSNSFIAAAKIELDQLIESHKRVKELEEENKTLISQMNELHVQLEKANDDYCNVQPDALLGKALIKAKEDKRITLISVRNEIIVHEPSGDSKLLEWYQQQLEKEGSDGL